MSPHRTEAQVKVIPRPPFGLFVLETPVVLGDGEIRFVDRCYAETLQQASADVRDLLIVARTRHHSVAQGYTSLSNAGAQLAIPLPDYGHAGFRGVIQALKILIDPDIYYALSQLLSQADFVYVEGGTSVISFLTARIAKRLNRRLVLEMRGDVLLNRQYLLDRFGFAGLAMLPLHQAFSRYVRKKCFAGLYINKKLLERYPVVGSLKRAVSDAYLPEDFGAAPRCYREPARRYLYVGHLETVKRVDLIIAALGLARERLPKGWHLEVVGSGPLERGLRAMTARLGLGSHLTFHGRIEWGEPLFRFYEQADLVLMASTSESGPRTLPEAMAFALPVISTSVGIAPELLDKSVLTPVGSAKAYAKCLLELVHDTARLTKFSESNWRFAGNFRRAPLVSERREFWRQAIAISRRERDQKIMCSHSP